MANQQKGVQQDTAIIVVNDHMYPRPCLYHFKNVSMTLLGQKRYRDGDTFTTIIAL